MNTVRRTIQFRMSSAWTKACRIGMDLEVTGSTWVFQCTWLLIGSLTDDGCEIQNCCDGRSGIMLQLKIVKSANQEAFEARRNSTTREREQSPLTSAEVEAIAAKEDANG
jgi:hypothetical protein